MAAKRGIDMSEKESKYAYKKKSAWTIFTKDQIKKAFDFSEEYGFVSNVYFDSKVSLLTLKYTF